MTKPKHLNNIVLEENAARLSNVIIDCMIQNQMTLENLDKACEIVKNIYRKNAIIRKTD